MFDMSKLGDIASMAREAKGIQEKQDKYQREHLDQLKKMNEKLDKVIELLKSRA